MFYGYLISHLSPAIDCALQTPTSTTVVTESILVNCYEAFPVEASSP
jgi:hypothetical protein